MARVTGVGGVFIRSPDPEALTAWYAEHLGVEVEAYGAVSFRWSDEVPAGTGRTTWSAFSEDADYFPADQAVMINYRVDDLDGLLTKLDAAGVWIDPNRMDEVYGKFAWIRDLDGRRIELWEPKAPGDS